MGPDFLQNISGSSKVQVEKRVFSFTCTTFNLCTIVAISMTFRHFCDNFVISCYT